jgi:hypothetical protein
VYLPSVLLSGSPPIGVVVVVGGVVGGCCCWRLLLLAVVVVARFIATVQLQFSFHHPLTMASNERSTHNSSQADCQAVPSSVYFERWENRSASRDHLYLGKTAGTGRTPNNVLTCWEGNMGFTVRSPIPSNFNDVDSWKDAVTPCCHCTAFQGDRPLKKKLLKCNSKEDFL